MCLLLDISDKNEKFCGRLHNNVTQLGLRYCGQNMALSGTIALLKNRTQIS